MIAPEVLVAEYALAVCHFLREVERGGPDAGNVVSIKLIDYHDRHFSFETDGEKFLLEAAGYHFIEFEYEDHEKIGMVRNLAAVAETVWQGSYVVQRRGRIEVKIQDQFFGGQLIDGR